MMIENREQEREELYRTIWSIANELRGSVDGWDFKQYVLGMLFYRYLSEHLTRYIENLKGMGIQDWSDGLKTIDEEVRQKIIIRDNGYFIPSQHLFKNVLKQAHAGSISLDEMLSKIFEQIDADSKENFKKLFDSIDVSSTHLGNSAKERNEKLRKVMQAVADMKLEASNTTIDLFGDVYEYLMGMYASNAGKSGGEYYTPPEVSELLVQLTQVHTKEIQRVYDPACGSGSLLLKFKKFVPNPYLQYYGQELNLTTYNLCRINLILHEIGFNHFEIYHGNTLTDGHAFLKQRSVEYNNHGSEQAISFDAIVSNPPYSIKWEGKDAPALWNDERFSSAGALAPKSNADFAFILHALYFLKETGTAAIVCFPGIFYRGGAEKTIRKYLIDQNYVDAVIQLPSNLFYGTSIATCILVLRKNKENEPRVQFIDASNEFVKATNSNKLSPKNIQTILDVYRAHADQPHVSRLVTKEEIEAKDYNLSVSTYVEKPDTREKVDIRALNAELKAVVQRENELRTKLDAIIAELEA